MRTLFLSLLCLFGALTILQAQDSSYGIAYQAVARDADGDPLADTELSVRVTLKDGATTVWQEEHASVLTNQFGNLALTIGSGVTSSGTSLSDVDWSAAGLHFEIEVDAGSGSYASFGDVAVQAVPVAMYALNGQEEEIAALWTAFEAHEGDFNSFVTATNQSLSDLESDLQAQMNAADANLQGQLDAATAAIADNATGISDLATLSASEDAALLGMIENAEGDISILQVAVDQNTADLGDIFANMTVNPDGSMTFNDITVEDITVNGNLDIPGVFSAATGLFNYLSAGNADFEEVLMESANVEDLVFVTGQAFGPDSELDIDGTLNVDGSATFNGSVSVPSPSAGSDAANKAYVDAADATLQNNIDAEAAARAAADNAIQADVDQNELDSDAADAAEEAARIAADNAIQADVDQNE